MPSNNTISVVTACSLQRLKNLARVLDHWTGPVSVGLNIQENEMDSVVSALKSYPSLLKRGNLNLHLIYNAGVGTQFCDITQIQIWKLYIEHIICSLTLYTEQKAVTLASR